MQTRRLRGVATTSKLLLTVLVFASCESCVFVDASGMLAFLRLRGGQRPESPKIRGSSRNAAAEAASDAHDAEKICGPQSVKQEIVIEASAEECFAAASNFEDYPKWAGAAKKVTVKERQADGLGTLVDFVMGIFGMKTVNTMAYKYNRPHKMNWHITEGGIKELVGTYDFIQITPERTRVIYNLYVEPGFPFPELLKKATSRAVAHAALADLKKWTERLRRERIAAEDKAAGRTTENTLEGTEAVRHLVPLC